MKDDLTTIGICVGVFALLMLCTIAYYSAMIVVGAKIVQSIFGW